MISGCGFYCLLAISACQVASPDITHLDDHVEPVDYTKQELIKQDMIKQETVTGYSSGITTLSIINMLLITDFRTSLTYHKWRLRVTFTAISSSVDDHVITSEQLPFVCQTIEVTTESEEQTVSSSHSYPLQISPVSSCYGEIHTHEHTEVYLKPFFMFISVSILSEKSAV